MFMFVFLFPTIHPHQDQLYTQRFWVDFHVQGFANSFSLLLELLFSRLYLVASHFVVLSGFFLYYFGVLAVIIFNSLHRYTLLDT